MTTLYHLFEKQASMCLQNTAIVDEHSNHVPYAVLLTLVDDMVQLLQAERLTKYSILVIVLAPSAQFIALILACLKLGIPYIPLDINYPESYIKLILQSAQADTVIANQQLLGNVLNIKTISLDGFQVSHNQTIQTVENNEDTVTAYIIYTSGSTGSPKGVKISHRNCVSLIEAAKPIIPLDCYDSGVLFHSLSFDFSIWEMFYVLCNGARLIIAPTRVKKSVDLYGQFLVDHKVTFLNITPSMLYLLQKYLVNTQEKESNAIQLKTIIAGGEALHPMKMQQWFESPISQKVDLYNMYGITEGTIHTMYKKITKEDTLTNISPLGMPLSNVEVVVVNEYNNNVKNGEEGELCLTGKAVTSGYLNNCQDNEGRFFTRNIDGYYQRYFKTGDMVKQLNNGEYIYIARKNHVVNIKGYRVNVNIIESYLIQCGYVENVLVTTYIGSDGIKRLVAYLQGDSILINIGEVKNKIKNNLPVYMCPSLFFVVKQFPLTINNKIDVKSLGEIIPREYIPFEKTLPDEPADLKASIKEVWQRVLGRNDVGFDDNFFDAGGDSLLLPGLQYGLQQALGCDLELIDLIDYPNINKLSVYILSQLASNIC